GRRLICDHKPYVVELADGARVPARAVVIATGAKYRKLAVENLSRFEGVGVYYGATFIEAQLCKDEEVIVVGGGNSAGQAAVFLAATAKHVFVVVRSDGLTDTMSRYLIRRIEETPNITVLPLKLSISMARSTWVCELAERADWQDDKEEHCSPGRDDGSCSEHHVASRLCRVGWGRI